MTFDIRIFLYLLLAPLLVWGQDFDRLTIRPVLLDEGGYESGRVRWNQAQDWPDGDPELVALRAPEDSVVRYTMTMGPELPDEQACIEIDSTGQWFYNPCKFSTKAMRVTDGVLLPMLDENLSCTHDRIRASLGGGSGHRPFWSALKCSSNDNADFLIRIPPDLADSPTLRLWAYSSTAIGTPEYTIRRACTSPDEDEIFFQTQWEDSWGVSHNFGAANQVQVMEFELTNWFPVTNDLCVIGFHQTSSASVTTVVWGEIQ